VRILFIGAGALAARTARVVQRRGHEVVMVERAKAVLDSLASQLDCGFIHGDGTKPSVLKEADAASADVLLALTGDDQTNIIACLVGRSLGAKSVIPRVGDDDFEHICIELGLDRTVIPARTISRFLADMVEGQDILELSAAIKGEARTFVFAIHEGDEARIGDLDLPANTCVTHLYRDGEFLVADGDLELKVDDEVVVVTHRKNLPALRERFGK
jgi:trk system potassium uptake protein TrkA